MEVLGEEKNFSHFRYNPSGTSRGSLWKLLESQFLTINCEGRCCSIDSLKTGYSLGCGTRWRSCLRPQLTIAQNSPKEWSESLNIAVRDLIFDSLQWSSPLQWSTAAALPRCNLIFSDFQRVRCDLASFSVFPCLFKSKRKLGGDSSCENYNGISSFHRVKYSNSTRKSSPLSRGTKLSSALRSSQVALQKHVSGKGVVE